MFRSSRFRRLQRRSGIGLLAVIAACSLWPVASSAFAMATACSLVRASEVRGLLGYPVRLRKGETDADCAILAIPIKLDPEKLVPVHPTIDFTVFVDGTRPRSFSQELSAARKRGFGPVPGFGPSSYLVRGPQPGALGIYARRGSKVINFDVGPATSTISQAKAIALAQRIAKRM